MKQIIAVLVPVVSRRMNYRNVSNINFFNILLPSFMQSLTTRDKENFNYKFYLGFDAGDEFFDRQETLSGIKEEFARRKLDNISLELTRCQGTSHSPVRVWNILFQKAWKDGCQYFYQLGDDIEIVSAGWSESFVKALKKTNGVGVTGPLEFFHQKILTQSFVSKTHMGIFGFYFPPQIKNWYCDDWIHNVYKPNYNFWQKDKIVKNRSFSNGGPLYDIQKISLKELRKQINSDRLKLFKQLKEKGMPTETAFDKANRFLGELKTDIKHFFKNLRKFVKAKIFSLPPKNSDVCS